MAVAAFGLSAELSVSLVAADAFGGDLDFADAPEGEGELYEVLGRLFRGLFHNVPNCVGDRGLEHYSLGLEASKVHPHDLARLEHSQNHPVLWEVEHNLGTSACPYKCRESGTLVGVN